MKRRGFFGSIFKGAAVAAAAPFVARAADAQSALAPAAPLVPLDQTTFTVKAEVGSEMWQMEMLARDFYRMEALAAKMRIKHLEAGIRDYNMNIAGIDGLASPRSARKVEI